MYENVVIFGASSGGEKTARILKNIGIDILFYIDNDIKKNGLSLEGKPIREPNILVDSTTDYQIVIASMYHEEIQAQLLRMGVKADNIILKEKILIDYLDTHMGEMQLIEPIHKETETNGTDRIVVDLVGSTTFGGIEKWSITLAKALVERNKDISIFVEGDNIPFSVNDKIKLQKQEISYNSYTESIKDIANQIITHLPCTIVINRMNHVFMAAYLVKKLYGNELRILSVIHSDFIRRYEQNQLFQTEIDAFISVSPDIKKNLINQYYLSEKKVFFKESPVYYDNQYIKEYTKKETAITIGYGGRIEKSQKRADLLIPLIEQLEAIGLRYKLYIAGHGSFFHKLDAFVSNNNLQDKVILFGNLPYQEMDAFWKQCDIFINLSEMEGTSLSMLEAMSFGAVPIVTNTSGVSEFIDDGVNGYICNIGDTPAIVNYIQELSDNRNKLTDFGLLSREVIKERCSMDKYIDFIENIINNA